MPAIKANEAKYTRAFNLAKWPLFVELAFFDDDRTKSGPVSSLLSGLACAVGIWHRVRLDLS